MLAFFICQFYFFHHTPPIRYKERVFELCYENKGIQVNVRRKFIKNQSNALSFSVISFIPIGSSPSKYSRDKSPMILPAL